MWGFGGFCNGWKKLHFWTGAGVLFPSWSRHFLAFVWIWSLALSKQTGQACPLPFTIRPPVSEWVDWTTTEGNDMYPSYLLKRGIILLHLLHPADKKKTASFPCWSMLVLACWSPPAYQHQNTTYAGIAGLTSMHCAGRAGNQLCRSLLVFLAGLL